MSKKFISLFLIAAISLSVMTTSVFADNSKTVFSDVDASTQEGAAIYKLYENGIIDGNGDGTFTPNNFVTRAELCKMVNNIWNLTAPAKEGFKDVTEKDWFYNHVLIGKEAGYIKGFDDGTFKGNNNVTREQACAIVCRVSGIKDVEKTVIISDTVSAWAIGDVKKIIANGLVDIEANNTFRATQNMKRGELAKLLAQFVKDKTSDNNQTSTNPSVGGNTGSGNTGGGNTGGGNTGGGNTGGGNTGGGNTGSGNGNSGTTTPPTDYTAQNQTVISNLTIAKTELTNNRELFTPVEKELVDIVINVLNNLINDKAKYLITTESVYLNYTEQIMNALDKYSAFDTSAKSSFTSKISQLNNQVFNFLQTFFGVDLSDINNL